MANTFLENLCAPYIDTVMLNGPIMSTKKYQKVELIYSLISKIEVRLCSRLVSKHSLVI